MTNESSERAAAIRAGAWQLPPDDPDVVTATEVMAGIQVGTVAFGEIDDEAVDLLVKTFGAEGVATALAAADAAAAHAADTPATSAAGTQGAMVTPFTRRKTAATSMSARSHAPMWLGLAASAAIAAVAAGVYFRSGTEPATAPPVAVNPGTPSTPSDPTTPPPQPVQEGELALQWIPETLPGSSMQNGGGIPLPQALPDFGSVPPGGTTLGAPAQNRYEVMQRSTVIVRSENGWGSGAFISADGWLVTNYHVVEEAAQKAAATGAAATLEIITPTVVDGRVKPGPTVSARLYRADPVVDLALLKLEQPPAAPLPFFRLAAAVNTGEECIVIGSQSNGPAWWVRRVEVSQVFEYPTDLSQNAAGMSSARPSLDRNRVTVIVSDARVSGGDSGGPLLNDGGDLIGLTFATSANDSSGAVGWHVALPHLRSFVANLPNTPEGVPFDAWTAGLGERVAFQPELVDGDRDGRVDAAGYVYAQPAGRDGPPRPLARTLFVDFQQRTPRTGAFTEMVPVGLWGLEGRGRFRFDVFVTSRADGVAAVGYTNDQGVVNEIRLGRVRDDRATAIWTRNAAGRWQLSRPAAATSMIDRARLGPERIERLQMLTGEQVAASPRGGAEPRPGAPAPQGRGRGPNRL
jgi:S1-C subfamily serine protease